MRKDLGNHSLSPRATLRAGRFYSYDEPQAVDGTVSPSPRRAICKGRRTQAVRASPPKGTGRG